MAYCRASATIFPTDQPPFPEFSRFAPYLRANQNEYSDMAVEVIRVANIAVCVLTILALITGPAPPPRR